MQFLRESRSKKLQQLYNFKQSYPQDERALKHSLRTCVPKCLNFHQITMKAGEKECLENCLWKYGQVLSRDFYLIMNDLMHGVAGGLAGISVDCVFYPLETIKTRIMASTSSENLRSIALSKFRGFSCQMIASFPYAFTFFYTYEAVRSQLKEYSAKDITASALAEVNANIVRNPFEIIKQQLMVGRSGKILVTFEQLVKAKGISGLYIGLKATLARDILFSCIQLPLFEKLRQRNDFNLSPVKAASLSGAIAASIAGFISCPLDVIKTRLMTQDFKFEYTIHMVYKIYNQFGIRGFFRGAAFRCGILSFGGIIYFGALQESRILFGLEHRVDPFL